MFGNKIQLWGVPPDFSFLVFAESRATQSCFAARTLRENTVYLDNPQMALIADCFRPFVAHVLSSQDVAGLLCERLVKILSGYHECLESQGI